MSALFRPFGPSRVVGGGKGRQVTQYPRNAKEAHKRTQSKQGTKCDKAAKSTEHKLVRDQAASAGIGTEDDGVTGVIGTSDVRDRPCK